MAGNYISTDLQDKKLEFMESVFEKYGAKPVSEDMTRGEGERRMFLYNGDYFRVGKLPTNENDETYMVISSIDNEKYAKVGLLEDIEAVPFSTADADLEKLGRYILGIEPYPEDYYK